MLLNQRYWDIFSVSDDSSIKKACQIMDEKKIGALLVHCPESGNPQDLKGILTERDIIELISRKNAVIDDFKVKHIMSEKIISISSKETAGDALNLMIENQIRHLAVMEDGNLIGVLSMRDILKKN
jgi:signal-transduction protein with cAMP-binding, CBS, and nucleotidyltransferase domain